MLRDHFIRKNGYFYRSDKSGYTGEVLHAGLYTKEDAEREARIEPGNIKAVPVTEYLDEIEYIRRSLMRLNSALPS